MAGLAFKWTSTSPSRKASVPSLGGEPAELYKQGVRQSGREKVPEVWGDMNGDRHLGSYVDLKLRKEEEFIGDRISTFYCISCGYIELYREGDTRKQNQTF